MTSRGTTTAPVRPSFSRFDLDHARGLAVALDEDAARSAARERLEPHRAGAREEVEARAPSTGPTREKAASRTRSRWAG